MGPTTPPADQKPTGVRFGVLGFACSLALVTYLDRVCIMRVKENITGELSITDQQMGWVFSAFTLGYLIFEVPGGWMGDAWGSRRVLTLIVLWWSIFTALTGVVWPFSYDSGQTIQLFGASLPLVFNAFVLLWLVRFLFGSGEAAAFPNLARVVGDWFPFRERGVAQGSIWTCARLGGAFAPLATGRLAAEVGWRPAFWILGSVGFVWCVFFYLWFRDRPEQKPQVNAAERDLIREGPAVAGHSGHALPFWRLPLLNWNLWALCLVSASISFSWYFYVTWQFTYFKQTHDIGDRALEIITGLPLLVGAVGSFIGGWVSDRLVRRIGRRWGRSLVGVVGCGGAGVCFLAASQVSAVWEVVVLFCLASFLNDLAVPVIWAASTDVGGRYAGTVAGVMNTMGGFGPIISLPLTPYLAGGRGWSGTLVVLGSAWFVAALAWACVDASKPLIAEPGSAADGEGLSRDREKRPENLLTGAGESEGNEQIRE